ncbi:DUF3099 domain-containing protein [Lysinimonas soli]|uniref:DUF3099 domain-containing protein n=1 Tax=Lysinimonas soli TaxID=1074233 RepID=A0ABW0NM06_9MICO
MRAKPVSITELPPSPDVERHSRMIKYAIAQAIRVVCIVACLFVPGWWMLLPAAGAVFLPYFAVVIANNVQHPRMSVRRPGAIVPVTVAEHGPGHSA